MNTRISDFIGDFISSEYFFFITPPLKEYAEALLEHFCNNVTLPLALPDIEKLLFSMAKTDVPVSVRKEIPGLLVSFFDYLSLSGKYPPAASLTSDIHLLSPSYAALFRDDGSVRGVTFEKKASGTGRNDPCPCGSGNKFKKCCGKQLP